jgi:tetratricopeptide (TPR) repeat protein
MVINRGLLIVFLLVFVACGRSANKKSDIMRRDIKRGNQYFSEKDILKEINTLDKIRDYPHAHVLLDTLILQNKNNGFLHYERGYIETGQRRFDDAIADYNKAKSLNFKPEVCNKMIFFCKYVSNYGKKN